MGIGVLEPIELHLADVLPGDVVMVEWRPPSTSTEPRRSLVRPGDGSAPPPGRRCGLDFAACARSFSLSPS